ncbi:hypothetical protein PO903_18730 [Paenibacillus sp. PK4536]|uniref:hypothetical protein n=1 Tax=Paenibacillus sp. PK4536 TaxID=3024576 RepID=UPI002359B190|nr:hypothetical protein [Paenibacillus sp. PK4536]WIM38666.1 hypothetical protein PO903_18730 [Paenibacillus sp. PK4536]
MLRSSFLTSGLKIIADCQQQSGDIWDAHYGTASIAAYFLAQSPTITDEVATALLNQAEQMTTQYELTSTTYLSEDQSVKEKAAIQDSTTSLSSHNPEQELKSTLSSPDELISYADASMFILEALQANIDQLHWVGHNVIYAAVSLLAMREQNVWECRADIERIQQLITAFDRTIPGRSWIGYKVSDVKKLEITTEDHFPAITSPAELSAFILQELAATERIYLAEAHHDLIGHTLTFAHALNILHDLGQPELFQRGLHPLWKMVKILRYSRDWDGSTVEAVGLYSPVDRLPLQYATPAPFEYTDIRFWQQNLASVDWDYGHHFKFVWSYNDHIERSPLWSEATSVPFHCLIKTVKEEKA